MDFGGVPLGDYGGVPHAAVQQAMMLCCECGVTIVPNPTAMCVNCLRSRVDITEGIPKQATVYFCKGCERYLSPPSQWVPAQLESRELLALCLKRLKGLNKVRLIDAGFIWTEPHSKRLKVRLKVQQEVSGAILEQIFVVEYVVHSQMCEACHRREAKDTWKAVVQIRQKVSHKKTFFYLEQLIIRHQAQQYCVNIKAHPDGLDFFFGTKSDAKRMVDFLSSVVPQRYKTSEQLISHDIHTNEFNFKYTFSVELPPICRDDVVCLPPALAKACGNISQIVICTRVTGSIHFVNPLTLQTCEVSSTVYWRQPFGALCSGNHLTEYIVLDIEPATAPDGSPISSTKHVLAHATLARVRDFGVNDCQMTALTHLGHLLQPGDCAWGFDLSCSNTNDEYANRLDLSHYEVILVKKSYSERRKRHRRRNWKLKLLTKEELNIKGDPNAEKDYENFLQELEEDPELRQNVHIYRDPSALGAPSEAGDEDDGLRVGLDEMLDDFDAMTLEPTGSLAEQQAIQQMQQASILQQLQAEQGADQVMATMVQQDQWAMQQQQQLQQQFLIEQQQLLMEQQQLLYEQQMGFTDSNHPHQQS